MKFLIINGPNLNLLGKREPGIYGENSYESLCARLRDFAAAHGATAECFQSNHEGSGETESKPATRAVEAQSHCQLFLRSLYPYPPLFRNIYAPPGCQRGGLFRQRQYITG